jgi:HSP20 family protein
MATLVRWDPFRDAAVMHNELSRLMNGLFEGTGRETQAWVPTLDVWETDDSVVYAFDLPGVSQDAVSVEVEDGALTVTATRERKQELDTERFHRLERRYGSFTRTVGLPQGVTEDEIKAAYTDGVLEITVPKPAQAKPKKIEVQVSGSSNEPRTIEGTSSK